MISACCDACGVKYEGAAMDKKAIDAGTTADGWEIRNGLHFCPKHVGEQPVTAVQESIRRRYGCERTKELNETKGERL